MSFVLTTMNISNMEKSLAFYHDLLGLPVVDQIGTEGDAFRICFFGNSDGTKLELIQGNGEPAPSEAISVGIVPERDIDEVLEACKDTAIGPISPNPHTTFWFVRDPDGYRVQLMGQSH